MTLKFENCKYYWELEDKLKDGFKSLPFESILEFETTAEILKLACSEYEQSTSLFQGIWNYVTAYKRTQLQKSLNPELQNRIEGFLEYLSTPSNEINANYVSDNLGQFNLEYDDIKNLSPKAFEAECINAYRAIVINQFQEYANQLLKMPVKEKLQAVKDIKKRQSELKKAQAALQARSQAIHAPRDSTHSNHLKEILGGAQRYDMLIELLKAEANITDCHDSRGQIQGTLTDEDGHAWEFELVAQDTKRIACFLKNADTLKLDPQNGDNVVARYSIPVYSTVNKATLPSGYFNFQMQTVKDILLTQIKQLSYVGLCFAYGKTFNIDDERVAMKISSLFTSNHFPPRNEIKEMIQNLNQPLEGQDLLALLAHTLGIPVEMIEISSNQSQSGDQEGGDEEPDSDDFGRALLQALNVEQQRQDHRQVERRNPRRATANPYRR